MTERDALVARLLSGEHGWLAGGLNRDAADQIERDGREIERLREVLKKRTLQAVERLVDWLNADEDNATLLLSSLTPEELAAARAALNGEGET